ncbi:MAG TPA: phosphoribosylglycinamide formyltransferase [Burkholderiaceae bacterium]|nr:phosphoribosylglycinamide formyltransferase [Burkholderiaceae bacterium]
MKRIAILISGRGSNMQAIVRACAAEGWDARVVAVIANRADAQGLAFARQHGIATEVVDHKGFASREAFDAELARTLDGFAPDVVALAGFMRILGDAFVERFAGRLINVHPSLLPAFTGLHTHARAIAAGCKLAGATVHFVTPALDHGPIIAQAVVPVLPDDTPALLAARVLEREHVLYPRAVRWLVQGLLRVDDGVVTHTGGEAQLLR